MYKHVLFLFFIIILSACTAKQKEIQTFEPVGSQKNLLFQNHSAKSGTKVSNFDENNNSASLPAIKFGDKDGHDFTHILRIQKSHISVTSDSTIRFNDDPHELIMRTDSLGNIYYINEEFTDSLGLEKSVIKIVRKNEDIYVFTYSITYYKESGPSNSYIVDIYNRYQKAKKENDPNIKLYEQRFKEVYGDRYVVAFIEQRFKLLE